MKFKITRRNFITTSAAAAGILGFPTIIPAAAFGAGNKIALGCIGIGRIGTQNLNNFLALEDCRVVAVCDTYQDRREKARQLVDAKNGDQGCAMLSDFRELIARKDIDAVMIAAQDHWHALMATAAAAAGKDMYCEKPLGTSVGEGQAIRASIRKHQRVFQAGTWQRSQGKFRQACELARNGYVGKIHTVHVSAPSMSLQPIYRGPLEPQPVPEGFDWEMWRGPAPNKPYNRGRVDWPDWYLIWDYCAGFICNWGVHHLDIANWGCPQLGTEPFEVECKGVYRRKGFADNLETWSATFTFASGLKLIFTDDSHQKLGTRFTGDQGWVHVDRAGIWAEPESLLKVKLKDEELHLHRSDNHGDDFLACMRSRKDPVSDVDTTYVASTLALIAEISARLETKLKWDPKTEKFIGNAEANARLTRPMHNGWKLV